MKTVCLAILTINSCLNADFTRTISGVVTDTKSSLQWQDNYNDNNNFIKKTSWTKAIDYCENLVLEGENDWKVPNIKELQSIINNEELIFGLNEIFKNKKASSYWSSTTYKRLPYSNVWKVDFSNGSTLKGEKKDSISFIRCVRTEE
jgi:hypothetical protein